MMDQAIYYMATQGAEAAHRDKEIVNLEFRELGELIVVSVESPLMVGSLNLDAAVVMLATPANVETVIVNGEIVKMEGCNESIGMCSRRGLPGIE